MKTQPFLAFVFCCILLGTGSCSITRNYTTRSELWEHSGRLLVLTKDSAKYYLDRFSLKDSTMQGFGTREHRNFVADFEGEISLKDVTYVIGSPAINFWDVLGFTAVLLAATPAIEAAGGPSSSVNAAEYPEPLGGGSSCPTLYAWNGSAYELDGEAFGTALGKALETETGTVLHSLKPAEDLLRVRISNERPETHYLNSVRLYSVAHDPRSRVVLDGQNRPWSASHPLQPVSATDHSGRSVLSLIGASDNATWCSDLAKALPGLDFKDEIILEFEAGKSSMAGVMIRAINSRLSAVAFQKLYEVLGNEAIDFVFAAERDPEMILLLKQWLDIASLHVSYLTRDGWKEAGTVLPEASEVQFERLVLLDPASVDQDHLTIKLSALAGVWEINSVTVDYTLGPPLLMSPAPMISSRGPRQFTSGDTILHSDGAYLMLWPGDNLFLEYEQPQTMRTESVTYVLLTKGYLYEWPSADYVFGKEIFPAARGSRLMAAKVLLSNEGILLPLIYEEWKKR